MTEQEKDEIRNALGDYVRSEGCSCCQDRDAHEEAAERLGKLLDVPMYSDGSGYNFYLFATPRKGVDDELDN